MKTVNHNTFGKGQVISEDNGNVTIDFNGTIKTLVIAFSRLTNEDGTAYGVAFVAPKTKVKKQNKANFMTKEERAEYERTKMTNDEYEAWRQKAMWSSKSF